MNNSYTLYCNLSLSRKQPPPSRTWVSGRFGNPRSKLPPLEGVLDILRSPRSKTPPLEGVLAELESPSSKTPPLGPPGALQTCFLQNKTVSEQHQSMSLAVAPPQMT